MLKVYGASDDLIEVEGDIREEFSWTGAAYPEDEDNSRLLAFSNGLVLRIRYLNGIWRLTEVVHSDSVHILQAPEGDEFNYSDVAEILGEPITWVVFGTEIARATALKGKQSPT